MASVTVTIEIDDDLLRRARSRALRESRSLNALASEWLERYVDPDRRRGATEEIIAIAERGHASSGPGGRTWTRDDLYEERLGRFGR